MTIDKSVDIQGSGKIIVSGSNFKIDRSGSISDLLDADADYLKRLEIIENKDESDPVFVASPAYSITEIEKDNWNTAFGWGNNGGGGSLGYTPYDASNPAGYISSIGNTFAIGDGADTIDKVLQANNGFATPPAIKYNHTTSTWQCSNDGVIFFDIGSGGTSTGIDGGTWDTVYVGIGIDGGTWDTDYTGITPIDGGGW